MSNARIFPREEGQGLTRVLAKGSFSLCTQSATSYLFIIYVAVEARCWINLVCPWRATLKRGGPACANYSQTTLISQRLCFGLGRWEATVHVLALLKAICSIWPKTWWFIRRDTLIPLIAQQRDNFMVLKEFYWAAALDALTVLWGEKRTGSEDIKMMKWSSLKHL